jgi:predicted PurR-regulated permease PerM
MNNPKIAKTAIILLIIVLATVILVYAKPFLVPFTIAGLFALLLLPVCNWLQKRGMARALAALLGVLTIAIVGALIIFLIGWQVQALASEASSIEQQVTKKVQQLQQFIAGKLGMPVEEQQQLIKKQQVSGGGKLSGMLTGFLSGFGGLLTDTLLVLVYTFLFIYFRGRIKTFIAGISGASRKQDALKIMTKAQQVSQKYIGGLGIMIVMLWVMYGIGFSIVGVKHALFFAILCGLLEIVPFVGNLTGTAATVLMALAQGGDMYVVAGVLATYIVVQFIQTYLLEPLIVGSGVSINPLFTIIALVAGELLWGIPGMILAIPLVGIAKIICDHVEPLQPFGYLIGTDKKK